jgi:hypothetical protein
LTQRFEKGLYIPVDDLRHMVVSGLSDMSFEVPPATLEQVRLAREAASSMARIYSDNEFAVAIDDFWYGDKPDEVYAQKIGQRVRRVLLLPNLETTVQRLYSRNPSEGSFKKILEGAIRQLHSDIAAHPKINWLVIDSSGLSVEQTVDKILARTERT